MSATKEPTPQKLVDLTDHLLRSVVPDHNQGLGVPSSYLGPSSPPQAGVSGCPLYGVGAPPGVGASAPYPENFGVGAAPAGVAAEYPLDGVGAVLRSLPGVGAS